MHQGDRKQGAGPREDASHTVRRVAALGLVTALLMGGAASLPSGSTAPVLSEVTPQEAQAFLRIRIPMSCDSFWGQFMRNCRSRYA